MSQQDKGRYYRALTASGVEFEKHYRNYTVEELRTNYEALAAAGYENLAPLEPEVTEEDLAKPSMTMAQIANLNEAPAQLPGEQLNRNAEDEPLFTDESTGYIWFQVEVRKPSGAQPRGRRVLRYTDTGTTTETVKVGEYTESFEVAGKGSPVAGEIKITLPSYQVGIYKDPRLPFKVHIYNEIRGFDFFEVNDYYGGADMVPEEIARMYVENVLCYDIRTVIRAIQTEFRQLQLQGRA